MRMTAADKVNAGFIVALGIAAVIGIASITSIRQYRETTRDVYRTHIALAELQAVLTTLATAESAERGFLITGDEDYLVPHDDAALRVLQRIHQLREETFEDPRQQRSIASLAALATARLRLMADVIEARRTAGEAAATAIVAEGSGMALMDEIRLHAAEIESVELARLAERERAVQLLGRTTLAIIGGGGIFAFLIVFASSVVIRRDITERRRAERALRESETLLSQFMENLPIGVMVIDTQWQPRFANNAAVDIAGPGVLIDLGDRPLPLYRASDHSPYPEPQTPLTRALAGETSMIDDAVIRTDTGFLPVQVSAAPVYDARGNTAYAIAAFDDITERRRVEEELRRARDAAEAASRTKSEFLARMSHELRTPLNSVIGFANVLLRNRSGNLTEQDITYLNRVLENGKHLLTLINEILDLAKIEAGKVEIEREQTDLADLVRSVVALSGPQSQPGLLDVSTELPPDMLPVMTDPARLRQVLTNLVGNAIKFTDRGTVTVAVDVARGSRRPVRIRVADTGIGIPADRLDAIFEAFEQADSTTARVYGGTGLGLPISRALCDALGYRLNVSSTVGAGSEFTIELAPPGTAAGTQGRWAGRRTLLIERETGSLGRIGALLDSTGMTCRTVASGRAGLAALREFQPDLVLTDLLAPSLNGLSFAEVLRATPGFRTMPLLVVAAADVAVRQKQRLLRHASAVLLDDDALETRLHSQLGSLLDGVSGGASTSA